MKLQVGRICLEVILHFSGAVSDSAVIFSINIFSQFQNLEGKRPFVIYIYIYK